MLKYLGFNNWFYETNGHMYYIVKGDLDYLVYAVAEGLKHIMNTQTMSKAVSKINEEEN